MDDSASTIPIETDKRSDLLNPGEFDRLGLILDEYLRALEHGAAPSISTLQARHPDLAAPLKVYLEKLHAFRELIPDVDGGLPRALIYTSEGREADPICLGDYRLVKAIGRGGMGIVYEAEQISLRRPVALKILPWIAGFDERRITRFRLEALAAARLRHPHLVPVHALGQERGVHYYVMPLIQGASLSRLLDIWRGTAEGTPESIPGWTPPAQSVILDGIARIADALETAHLAGIVHRDIKPSNLLVDFEGKVWLTDFGLARCADESTLTRTGDVVGTYRYMSPEQSHGGPAELDGRSDIYSLGATLKEILTLEPAGPRDLSSIHVSKTATEPASWRSRPVPRPRLPLELEAVLEKAMATDPAQRYPRMADFADDLRRAQNGVPTRARPRHWTRAVWRRSRAFARRRAWALLLVTLGMLPLWAFLAPNGVPQAADALPLARAYQQAGALASERGMHSDAVRALADAEHHFAAARAAARGNHSKQELTRQWLDSVAELGQAQLRDGEPNAAELTVQEGLRVLASQHDPSSESQAVCMARFHELLGLIDQQLGRDKQGTSQLLAAAKALQPFSSSVHPELRRRRASIWNHLASDKVAFSITRRIELYHLALRELDALDHDDGEDGGDTRIARRRASVLANLAWALQQGGDADQALNVLDQSLIIQRRIRQQDPLDRTIARELAAGLNNLGQWEFQRGHRQAAHTHAQEANDILMSLAGFSEDAAVQSELGRSHHNLALLFEADGDTGEAERHYDSAAAHQRRAIALAPAVRDHQVLLVRHLAARRNNLRNIGPWTGTEPNR